MHLRSATPADAPRLATLATQLGYPSLTADILRRLLGIKQLVHPIAPFRN